MVTPAAVAATFTGDVTQYVPAARRTVSPARALPSAWRMCAVSSRGVASQSPLAIGSIEYVRGVGPASTGVMSHSEKPFSIVAIEHRRATDS